MADIDDIRGGRRRDWWAKREQKRKSEFMRSPMNQMKKLIHDNSSPDASPAAAPEDESLLKSFFSSGREDEAGAADNSIPAGNGASESSTDHKGSGASGAAAAPAKIPKRGTHEWRLYMERQRNQSEWRRTRKQVMALLILGGLALAIIGGFYGIHYIVYGARERAEIKEFMARSSRGENLFDLSSPMRALATYRSAWIRGDMTALWEMTVLQTQKDILSVRSLDRHLAEQRQMYKIGSFGDWVNVIKEMDSPKYYKKPLFSSRDGELAVFISPPHVPKGQHAVPIRYIVAFGYQRGKWRFVQSCPEKSWRSQWTTLYNVKPSGFQQKL